MSEKETIQAKGPLNDRRAGKKRRAILEYLLAHKEASLYEVAKKVYGNGTAYSKVTSQHIRKLECAKILKVDERTEKGRKRKFISVTKQGRLFCIHEGLTAPSSRGEELVASLGFLGKGLSDDEIDSGKRILNEEVVNTCLAILTEETNRRREDLKKIGLRLPFSEKTSRSEAELKLDPLSTYFVALAYYGEKDVLPQLYESLEKSKDDPNLGPVFRMTQQMMEDQRMLVALPTVKRRGLERDFDDLADWFQKVGVKVPAFSYLPYFMIGPSWLTSLNYLVTTIADILLAPLRLGERILAAENIKLKAEIDKLKNQLNKKS